MLTRPAERRRILIADDNPDAASALAELLGLYAYDTRTAHDGNQAVELAQSFAPDMVILDINMPGMDGYQAARALRSTPGQRDDLVLVALTGRTAASDNEEAQRAGFDFHIPKPVDGVELCHLVDGVLKRPSRNARSARRDVRPS